MTLPEPVYRDEYIIQYKAEVEDIVWELPPKIFSAVITDPPYLLVGDKKMNWDGGRGYVSDIDDNGFADDFDFTLLDMFDRLCINTNMTFFCNKAQLYNYFKWVYNNKKNFNLLSWHKPNCIPIGALYLLDTEFCVHTWEKMKTKRKPMNTYFIHNIVNSEYDHPCLHPDSLVLTSSGLKEIKDTIIGEQVYSEDGKFHNIIDKTNHLYTEQLYEIITIGTNLTVKATHNHPFLIYRPIHGKRKIEGYVVNFIKSESIRVGDYTMTPIMQSDNKITHTNKELNFWFIAGLWLAEGNLQDAGHGYNKYPVFSLHEKEDYYLDMIKTQTTKNVSKYSSKNSKGISIIAFDPDLAIKYRQLFSTGAKDKKLNQKIFNLSKEEKESLLNGYLAGDGCIVRGDYIAKTASRTLAFQLKMLSESIGYISSVYEYTEDKDKYIGDRLIKPGTTYYQVYINKGTRDGNIKNINKPIEVMYNGILYRLNYIKDIIKTDYTGNVVNLSIEESPTFMTVIGMSHNTPKPERVVTEIIRQITDEGDIVFEPFAGTGTTAVCCKRLKRKCIAVERKERYVGYCIDRYKKTEAGIDQASFM